MAAPLYDADLSTQRRRRDLCRRIDQPRDSGHDVGGARRCWRRPGGLATEGRPSLVGAAVHLWEGRRRAPHEDSMALVLAIPAMGAESQPVVTGPAKGEIG